ncbi:hypothetical protein KMW28_03895 [Flammeovirga yaeyamensis]|uniref:Lipoprotein n=1 Tax=Flammeovirga yaeyamensis TaxID=367791 RepID=A0AAX1N577_9BACT|nr:hypothetical protein [Flammeovirga yaeyamensis]MBB3701486.1 hypothetical protein [Flammeovirga yaeyamensis]NMF38609.1 hypothetical protein [Flammeovirga yaeyamensis]QWG02728.1 hypothetical protein KMW28_03895 [Flammeovirga yaeyamensis]
MKNISVFVVVALVFMALLSSCGGRNIEDVIPRSTAFEFSRGTEMYITEGKFQDTVKIDIYVPAKIVTVDVSTPFGKEDFHINLAEEPKEFGEEKMQESMLGKHTTYRHVLGAKDVRVHLVPEVMNSLSTGKHTITFAVLDEKDEYKQRDLNITVVPEKKK